MGAYGAGAATDAVNKMEPNQGSLTNTQPYFLPGSPTCTVDHTIEPATRNGSVPGSN